MFFHLTNYCETKDAFEIHNNPKMTEQVFESLCFALSIFKIHWKKLSTTTVQQPTFFLEF